MKDHAVKEKLLKRLSLNKQRLELNKASIVDLGGESKSTFHGGWSVGYYEGKVAAIESILDEIFDRWESQ